MKNKLNNFYNLDTWKKGHKFVLEIYKITKKFPKEELYGLISQLRRASSSITANIAEGFSRYHYNDKKRFYHNARCSLSEVQIFMLLAKDLSYLSSEELKHLMESSEEIFKLINGLIRSIEKQKDRD